MPHPESLYIRGPHQVGIAGTLKTLRTINPEQRLNLNEEVEDSVKVKIEQGRGPFGQFLLTFAERTDFKDPDSPYAPIIPNLEQKIRSDLSVFASDPRFHSIASLVESYPIPPELLERIMQDPGKNRLTNLAVVDFDTLVSFLQWNSQFIGETIRQREDEVEGYINDFTDYVDDAIERRNLPMDPCEFQNRMALSSLYLQDPLELAKHTNETIPIGTYNADNALSTIAATLSPEELRATVHHELWHHISGKTVVAFSDAESYTQLEQVQVTRTGLTDSAHNEAMTETLAMISMHDTERSIDFADSDNTRQYLEMIEKSNSGYKNNMYILALMLAGGRLSKDVPLKVPLIEAVGAYLENYNPDEASGTRSSLRNIFISSLSDAYGGRRDILAESAKLQESDPQTAVEFLVSANWRQGLLSSLEPKGIKAHKPSKKMRAAIRQNKERIKALKVSRAQKS